jgi:hypothetical protein
MTSPYGASDSSTCATNPYEYLVHETTQSSTGISGSRDRNNNISDPTVRAMYLRDKLLERKTAGEDIADHWSQEATPPNESILWDISVTEEEARRATTGSGNTAPGAYGSLRGAPKTRMASNRKTCDFSEGELALDASPLPFRKAEITIISRSGGWRQYTPQLKDTDPPPCSPA